MSNENIDFYNNNSEELTNLYNKLSFLDVHGDILDKLPKEGRVLDIGCGSGRDSYYMAKELGLKVVAIDPSEEMLKKAKENFNHENLEFRIGKIPDLNLGNNKFDFILMSAVWMHIEPKERKQALLEVKDHLKRNANAVIYLRHGVFNDARVENPVSQKEIKEISEELNITSQSLDTKNHDVLKRGEVFWESMEIVNKPLVLDLKKKRKSKY
jgi:ubiquinone/menaquinone biosynthesis C-methylase UbiE